MLGLQRASSPQSMVEEAGPARVFRDSIKVTWDFHSNRLTTRRTLKMASQGGYAVVDADEEVHATLSGAVFS